MFVFIVIFRCFCYYSITVLCSHKKIVVIGVLTVPNGPYPFVSVLLPAELPGGCA